MLSGVQTWGESPLSPKKESSYLQLTKDHVAPTGSQIHLAGVLPKGKVDLKPIPQGASESSNGSATQHSLETWRASDTRIWSSALVFWPPPPALRTVRMHNLQALLLVKVLSYVSPLGSLVGPHSNTLVVFHSKSN